MDYARRTDFLLAAASLAPLAFALSDKPGAGVLVLVPLLLAACLHGAWERVEGGEPPR